MYVYSNLNPYGLKIGDCVVRAIAAAMGQTWERTYAGLCLEGFKYGDLPNSNPIWDSYLRSAGFKRFIVPDTCPDCYTVQRFAEDHQEGTFVVATGTHAVCVIDGDIYDNWNSSDLTATYYYVKE